MVVQPNEPMTERAGVHEAITEKHELGRLRSFCLFLENLNRAGQSLGFPLRSELLHIASWDSVGAKRLLGGELDAPKLKSLTLRMMKGKLQHRY